jgi:hypothetical protein
VLNPVSSAKYDIFDYPQAIKIDEVAYDRSMECWYP